MSVITRFISDHTLTVSQIFFMILGVHQKNFATVAQLVEQGPLKPKVLGSIPSRRTTMNMFQAEHVFR